MVEKGFQIDSLDGIRAIAVSLVFFAHAGLTLVPGGLGVTIFFFLSGYLITTLMRREYEASGTLSFRNFYLRRVYRIFPPLYIVLVICIVLAVLLNEKNNMNLRAVSSQFLHLTNYYQIFVSQEGLVPGLSVLWSLAVEEHFYLAFPLIFLLLARQLTLNQMALLLILFCLIVLAWRYYLYFNFDAPPIRTYKATDTRIDSIMWGCLLGVCFNPTIDREPVESKNTKIALFFLSMAILSFTLIYRDPAFRETLRYTLQGVSFLPLFYLAIKHSNWIIFRWLNWKSVKALGLISYTFYLFHNTGIDLASRFIGSSVTAKIIGGFVITTIFSSAMYLLVERHLANLRKRLHT